MHSITVPGAVEAWETLIADHGTKELGALLQPAIKAAEQGFVVQPRVAHDWANQVAKLEKGPRPESYLSASRQATDRRRRVHNRRSPRR